MGPIDFSYPDCLVMFIYLLDYTLAEEQPVPPRHISSMLFHAVLKFNSIYNSYKYINSPKKEVTPSAPIPDATQKRRRLRREDSYQQAIQHGLSESSTEMLGPTKAAQKGSVRFESIPESPSTPGKKTFLPRQPSYFELV